MNPQEIHNIDRAEREHWWYRGMNRITFALLERHCVLPPQARVLEAGAGTGFFAERLAARLGVSVDALDYDQEGARLCGTRKRVRAVQGTMDALPFPDRTFDFVTSMDVLVHWDRGAERQPMAEMVRVLKPSGKALIRVSAFDALRSRHSIFAWEKQRFTPRRLRALAKDSGLEVERLTCANALLSPLALVKFRIWEPLMRAPAASGVTPLPRPMEFVFGQALAAEAKLLASGVNLPFGQSLFLIARKPAAGA